MPNDKHVDPLLSTCLIYPNELCFLEPQIKTERMKWRLAAVNQPPFGNFPLQLRVETSLVWPSHLPHQLALIPGILEVIWPAVCWATSPPWTSHQTRRLGYHPEPKQKHYPPVITTPTQGPITQNPARGFPLFTYLTHLPKQACAMFFFLVLFLSNAEPCFVTLVRLIQAALRVLHGRKCYKSGKTERLRE